MIAALLLTLFSASAHSAVMIAQVEGMDCVSCQVKIVKALEALPFIDTAMASTTEGSACAKLNATLDEAAVTRAISDLGYTLSELSTDEQCPRRKRVNWGDIEDLDVQVISRGEAVNIDEYIEPGKFTIIDFGAIWCAPCHAAESLLKAYLSDHADTAVRAVILDGQNPETSFAQPAAQQHLMSAPGIPFFIVYNPRGKIIYRGIDVVRVLKKLDNKR